MALREGCSWIAGCLYSVCVPTPRPSFRVRKQCVLEMEHTQSRPWNGFIYFYFNAYIMLGIV